MEQNNLISDDESIIELKHEPQDQPVETIKKPRAKRVVNEKTLEALKKVARN